MCVGSIIVPPCSSIILSGVVPCCFLLSCCVICCSVSFLRCLRLQLSFSIWVSSQFPRSSHLQSLSVQYVILFFGGLVVFLLGLL